MANNETINGSEVKVKTIEYKGQTVYVGKYGYYEYDYNTFLKLKFLNKCLTKAMKKAAIWYRWARKENKNRVQKIYKKDLIGRKIGIEKIIPISEPEFDSVDKMFIKLEDNYPLNYANCFRVYQRTNKTLWFEMDKDKKLEFIKHPKWYKVPINANYYYYYFFPKNHNKIIIINTMGIDRIYKNARKPKTLEEIKLPEMSVEEINKLYNMIKYELDFDNHLKSD